MSICIPWTGRINGDGYGTRGTKLAHRAVWEDSNGPIPANHELDHTCHNPELCKLGSACPHRRCVNLEHLEPVTPDENKRRSGSAGPRITHCVADHEYTPENTGRSRTGTRYCKTCKRIKARDLVSANRPARCARNGHEPQYVEDVRGRTYCYRCAQIKTVSAKPRSKQASKTKTPVKHLGLQLPADLADAVEADAAARGTTKSEIVRELLAAAYKV